MVGDGGGFRPRRRLGVVVSFACLLMVCVGGWPGAAPALHLHARTHDGAAKAAAEGWHVLPNLSVLSPAPRPPRVDRAVPGPGAAAESAFAAACFDLHFDPARTGAPVVIRLPSRVDGTATRAPRNFLERWVERGFVVVDLHPRGLPEHTVIDAAHDVTRVIAWLQLHVERYGGNRESITLLGIGHGGHTAALIGADPRYLRASGVEFTRLARVALVAPTTLNGPVPPLGPAAAWFGDGDVTEVLPRYRVVLGSIHPDLLFAPAMRQDHTDPNQPILVPEVLWHHLPDRLKIVGTRVTSLDVAEIHGPLDRAIEERLAHTEDPWSRTVIAFCEGRRSPPEPVFRRTDAPKGGVEYVIPRVHTPAWKRETPIPVSPLFVRRILRCGPCELDVNDDELRFICAEPIDEKLPSRIDEVARACGLVPYWEELERRALEAGAPGRLEPIEAGSIFGHAPVLLEWSESEQDGRPGVDLKVYVTRRSPIEGVGLTPPPPVAGEVVQLRLVRHGLSFHLSVTGREPYDPSFDPPLPDPNPTVLGLSNGTRVRLDRLTNHCRANDRYTLRLIADDHRERARVLALDSEAMYGTIAWREVSLGCPGLLVFREDQGEGSLVFYFTGEEPEDGRF